MSTRKLAGSVVLGLLPLLAWEPVKAGVVCANVTVMGQPQQACWTEDDSGGGDSGGGSGGGGGGGSEGGPGGGINPNGVWMDVPLDGKVVQLNMVKKIVRDKSLSCDDEPVLRQRAMQVVIIKNPWIKAKTAVTLEVSGGRERFFRCASAGSLQMFVIPGQECK